MENRLCTRPTYKGAFYGCDSNVTPWEYYRELTVCIHKLVGHSNIHEFLVSDVTLR